MKTDETESAIICGGSMSSSIAAARSLGRKGVHVHGVAFDRNHPLLRSKYCRETSVVSSPRDDYASFVASLSRIAESDEVHTMLPMNEYGIFTLMRNRAEFSDALDLVVPRTSSFDIVWDRKRLLEVADDCGVPTPENQLLTEWSQSPEPAVVKSRYSMLSENNRLQYPGVEFVEPNTTIDVEATMAEMGHEPLVQRYVPDGTEVGFFTVCDEGEPIVEFQHRRIRSTSYFGGASAHREAIRDPAVRELGVKILRELNWNGPAMVEFRRDGETGEYKLMEINPRFWGSLPLGIHAGIDFPWVYYQLSHGHAPEKTTEYDVGTRSSYLRGEVQHLLSLWLDDSPGFIDKPSITRTVYEQCLSIPSSNFDILDSTDIAPFAWDFLQSASRLLRGETN
ncbi:carboxylate--amine ligase [Halorussus ruber]|uniref:carboxylate--amine ligase n=1 Tax=Halorussus ruber TaxID=1126238 RepID=UPI001091C0B6|nr:ATP-grasp domain-containing protein [Halorussus ruber]